MLLLSLGFCDQTSSILEKPSRQVHVEIMLHETGAEEDYAKLWFTEHNGPSLHTTVSY